MCEDLKSRLVAHAKIAFSARRFLALIAYAGTMFSLLLLSSCGASSNPCDGVVCPEGAECHGGTCFSDDPAPDDPDPCDGIVCAEGAYCYQGSCFLADPTPTDPDPCDGVLCQEGFRCHGGTCFPDPCDGVLCPPGAECHQGTCFHEAVTESISGTVMRVTGGPLSNARVRVLDLAGEYKEETTSDSNGHFSVMAIVGETLEISVAGFTTVRVPITSTNVIVALVD